MKHERDAGAQGAHRHQRVESSILEELRTILRDDVTDPMLDDVRLTAIVLSGDSKLARLHYAVPSGRDRKDVEGAFQRASGFLRGRLAEGVELKRTPELRFVYEGEFGPEASGD